MGQLLAGGLLALLLPGGVPGSGAIAPSVRPDVSFDLRSAAAMPVTHEAIGLLNNLPKDANGRPMAVLQPLGIRNYRGLGSLDDYGALAELGTVRHSQVLLFMEWCWYWSPGNATVRCNAEHMPGAGGNWSSWEEHLRGVVIRKQALRKQTPSGPEIWWDIWSASHWPCNQTMRPLPHQKRSASLCAVGLTDWRFEPLPAALSIVPLSLDEPNGAPGGGFWPPGGICNLTQCLPDAHFLELWRRAVTVLRATDLDPVIVGPSTDAFDWAYITEFLLFARDNGVMPDVINWHELNRGSNGSEIPAHHRRMRLWLAANGMNASLPIAHNE